MNNLTVTPADGVSPHPKFDEYHWQWKPCTADDNYLPSGGYMVLSYRSKLVILQLIVNI